MQRIGLLGWRGQQRSWKDGVDDEAGQSGWSQTGEGPE